MSNTNKGTHSFSRATPGEPTIDNILIPLCWIVDPSGSDDLSKAKSALLQAILSCKPEEISAAETEDRQLYGFNYALQIWQERIETLFSES